LILALTRSQIKHVPSPFLAAQYFGFVYGPTAYLM
jgi:hypothetical protein